MRAPPGRTPSQTMGQARPLARDKPETNPITINPETASHVAEQFPWVPLPCCPPPRPLPNKVICFVSTCVSLDSSFLSVRQEPTLGPWKGSSFQQQGELTCLKQGTGGTPHPCAPDGGQDMAALFAPEGRGRLPVIEGIDIRSPEKPAEDHTPHCPFDKLS